MTVLRTSNILTRLALGELSNLKFAEGGVIAEASRPMALSHLNEAMKDLFTKFLLSQKEILLNVDIEITHYYLRKEYAISDLESTQPVQYLDDTECPDFDGRIAKILEVYDAFGRQLYLNKAQEPLSIFTPEHDCMLITANHQSEQFYVIFQALHPILYYDPGAETPLDTIINMPPSLERPLLLLTASKIYGPMNGQGNMAKSALLHQQYEMSLQDIEFRDSASTSENMSNSKLENSGFI